MLELYIISFSLVIVLLLTYKEIKKNYLFYLLLNLSGVIAGTIFEYSFISIGLWKHNLYPQLLGISLYAAFMYIPWITLTYWGSEKVSKYLNNRYMRYFLIGTLLGFFIEITSVNLGFYQYKLNSVFRIFNIPIEMTIIEGVAMTIFLVVSEKIISSVLNKIR